MERNALAQKGLSPKLLTDLVTTVVTFAVTYYGIELDPEVAAAISKVVGFLAGALVKPGRVVVENIGPASDDVLKNHPAAQNLEL